MAANEHSSDSVQLEVPSQSSKAHRKLLIVIHGWGGTFVEAVSRIHGLADFDCAWHKGVFFVERRIGQVLRQVLNAPEPDHCVQAFRKLIVSRFLAASTTPGGPPPESNEGVSRFTESQLLRDFPDLGIPISPGLRAQRADQLREEALQDLQPILPLVDRLREELAGEDGVAKSECEAREAIIKVSREVSSPYDLVALLELLRDMHESGGDLDTVASAVLYAYSLTESAAQSGRELQYGRDYSFIFVNYHERLDRLADYGPADLLMADLPIGAFPHLEEDVRTLAGHGIKVARFEDHHPYTAAQKEMLERLVKEGMLLHLALSGPIHGSELSPEELKCGADMVYESTVAGKPWDCKGARHLREAAHSEDFVQGRSDLGRLLTALIKGGICKAELAQELLLAIPEDNAAERLGNREWDKLAENWNSYFRDLGDQLGENAFVIHVKRSEPAGADQGGPSFGFGSDMPLSPDQNTRETCRILVALAIRSEPGKPKIGTGRVVEYYSRAFPDIDYVFYCYGGSLMVARRINQADLTFNLGELMPRLGSESDGGHAGAAVCRPEANENYPRKLLARVERSNFKRFVEYISMRLSAAGVEVIRVKDSSAPSGHHMRGSGKKLVFIMIAALAIGIVLAAVSSRFRPASIRESNSDFFPQLESSGEAGGDAG
jgi:hypothetical protein